MSKNLGHIVGGRKIFDSGEPINIFNPSNGKIISKISNASKETIDKTLNISIEAFEEEIIFYKNVHLYYLNLKFYLKKSQQTSQNN